MLKSRDRCSVMDSVRTGALRNRENDTRTGQLELGRIRTELHGESIRLSFNRHSAEQR